MARRRVVRRGLIVDTSGVRIDLGQVICVLMILGGVGLALYSMPESRSEIISALSRLPWPAIAGAIAAGSGVVGSITRRPLAERGPRDGVDDLEEEEGEK